MRSYYVFCRTTDNQFMHCSIQTAQAYPTDDHLIELAYREFKRIGNPLPPAYMIERLKLVQDARNWEDAAGYESVPDKPPTDDGYCVYSEYTHGDPTH